MPAAMKRHEGHFPGVMVASILTGSLLVLGASSSFGQSTAIHTATAYGAEVNVGTTVKLGKIAPAVLPTCSTNPNSTFTATAASAALSPFVSTGAVTSTAITTPNTSSGSSEVLGVSLLGGLITTSDVKAVSTTSVDSHNIYSFSSAGSQFAGLKVLGVSIAANPAPNTTIDLPLIGSVVLNEQISTVAGYKSVLTVNMIHVHVTLSNLLGLPLGTEVIIASASSEYSTVKGPSAVGGSAQSAQLVVGPISSGPLARVVIPCSGTGGAVKTDSVASASLPGVVNTGAVIVTGMGNITHTLANSEATTSIAGVNVLSGLVSATAIKGTADASTPDGTTFTFSGGSTFVGLSVAGHPEITVNVGVGTRVTIPGIGILFLNRVVKYPDKVRVTPIELQVTVANTLGLPVGADLTIGVAEAQLHSSTLP